MIEKVCIRGLQSLLATAREHKKDVSLQKIQRNYVITSKKYYPLSFFFTKKKLSTSHKNHEKNGQLSICEAVLWGECEAISARRSHATNTLSGSEL